MATPDAARNEWEHLLRAHPFQQFGQTDDESTFNGATACTHTDLQKLVLAKTGRMYSQDEISAIAGYPPASRNPGRRGLRWYTEIMAVVRHFGLPYEPYVYAGPLNTPVWTQIKVYLSRGPVMMAMRYSHYPERRGAIYNGVHADGKPNGYAISNGKTQLVGAESMGHAVMAIAYHDTGSGWVFDSFDPNHGSPARPEHPPFDRITPKQQQAVINSNRLRFAGDTRLPLQLLVPTHTFTPR
jgi:hypothetical protein